MCECNVYLSRKSKEEEVMEKVASVKVEDGKVHLVDLWGKTLSLDADLKELALLEHKIVLTKKS